MNKDIQNKYKLVDSLVNKIDNEDLKILSRFLGDRIANVDSYVMMLGETSSGKTSLINGLMRENNLIVSAAPSTGTITEIEFRDNLLNKEYYAINKNATIEEINKEIFDKLTKYPDKNLERLKLINKSPEYKFSNMRLFDTPGYGSIISEHEEILKEFIPNSDIIIYTINYKIGIQENDYAFLKFLKELIREDVEILLVINRCPNNVDFLNRRIIEIRKYIKDILHKEYPIFLVKNKVCQDEKEDPLPECPQLWNCMEKILDSPEREEKLSNIFLQYIKELGNKCENEIVKRYENIKLSKQEKQKIKNRTEQFVKDIESIIPNLIEPTFDKLIASLDKKMDIAKNNIQYEVSKSIDNISTLKKDETIAYISNHLLVYCVEVEIREIKEYIEVELNDLNDRINDYLNQEIMKYDKDIELYFSTATELAGKQIGKNIGKRLVDGGLVQYFTKFGGNGGAGAGVANAASHYLKVIGDKFGKKFSRATHNALKQRLSRIGATSLKAISNLAVVLIELLTLVVDIATWKLRLKNKSSKVIQAWYDNCLESMKKDLLELKQENISILRDVIKENKENFNYDDRVEDEEKIIELYNDLQDLKVDLEG